MYTEYKTSVTNLRSFLEQSTDSPFFGVILASDVKLLVFTCACERRLMAPEAHRAPPKCLPASGLL